jgi:hypothetical protein
MMFSMRTMTFLPRSTAPGSSDAGQLKSGLEGVCRIATTLSLPMAPRIRDKAWQGIGKTIPNAKENAKDKHGVAG